MGKASIILAALLFLAVSGMAQPIPAPATTSQATNLVVQDSYMSPARVGDFWNDVGIPFVLSNGGGTIASNSITKNNGTGTNLTIYGTLTSTNVDAKIISASNGVLVTASNIFSIKGSAGGVVPAPATTSQATNLVVQDVYMSPARVGDFWYDVAIPYIGTHGGGSFTPTNLNWGLIISNGTAPNLVLFTNTPAQFTNTYGQLIYFACDGTPISGISINGGITMTNLSGWLIYSNEAATIPFDTNNVLKIHWKPFSLLVPSGTNGLSGTNGYTPVFGVDYFNGTNGTNGLSGSNGTNAINWNFTSPLSVDMTGTNVGLSVTYSNNILATATNSFDAAGAATNLGNTVPVSMTNTANSFSGTFTGNGSGLTNIHYTNLTGTPTLGTLAASNSITSNNITGYVNYGQIYGTPVLGTAAGSNATAFVLINAGKATNLTLYGDVNATNWTATDVNGWLNTNTAGGYTRIQNGNATTSGTNTAGYFIGNGGGLTNLNAANLVGTLTNNTTGNATTASGGWPTTWASSSITAGNLPSTVTNTAPIAASQLPGGVLTNNETGVTVSGTFTGSGSGLTNLSVVSFYTNAGTYYWTNNANANLVSVILVAGGGGGGSGAREATNSARFGGGGGAGGGRSSMTFPASQLPSVVTNIVGAGGTNGIAVTANTTSGNAGGNGGTTSFGNLLKANGGGGGSGGTTSSGGAGSAGTGFSGTGGGAGTGTPITGTAGSASAYASGGGAGGSGSNPSAAPPPNNGAAGGGTDTYYNGTLAAGSGGFTNGVSPTSGSPDLMAMVSTGSGSGAYISATNGQAGAAAFWFGAGGGGGAASDNGYTSGAGGAGAPGAILIVTQF